MFSNRIARVEWVRKFGCSRDQRQAGRVQSRDLLGPRGLRPQKHRWRDAIGQFHPASSTQVMKPLRQVDTASNLDTQCSASHPEPCTNSGYPTLITETAEGSRWLGRGATNNRASSAALLSVHATSVRLSFKQSLLTPNLDTGNGIVDTLFWRGSCCQLSLLSSRMMGISGISAVDSPQTLAERAQAEIPSSWQRFEGTQAHHSEALPSWALLS